MKADSGEAGTNWRKEGVVADGVSYVTFRGSNWASDELSLRTRAAAVEVGRPIAFATLIVIAVFFPLFAMTGIEGRLYSSARCSGDRRNRGFPRSSAHPGSGIRSE